MYKRPLNKGAKLEEKPSGGLTKHSMKTERYDCHMTLFRFGVFSSMYK